MAFVSPTPCQSVTAAQAAPTTSASSSSFLAGHRRPYNQSHPALRQNRNRPTHMIRAPPHRGATRTVTRPVTVTASPMAPTAARISTVTSVTTTTAATATTTTLVTPAVTAPPTPQHLSRSPSTSTTTPLPSGRKHTHSKLTQVVDPATWTPVPDSWNPASAIAAVSLSNSGSALLSSVNVTSRLAVAADPERAGPVVKDADRADPSKNNHVAAAAFVAVVTAPSSAVSASPTAESAPLHTPKATSVATRVGRRRGMTVLDQPPRKEPVEKSIVGTVHEDVVREESYFLDLDVVDPTAPAPAKGVRSSRRRRATSKPFSEDILRAYLHEIGDVKLLGAQAEVHLARDIAKLLHLERVSLAHKETTGGEPSLVDWAHQAGMDVEALRNAIRRGLRAKERMVAANLRLVVSIAKKYLNRGLSFSDLIQEGSIGLIRGAEKFDADKGFKFSTYATWWIRQAITRAIADQSRPIRLPVHVNDTISAIKRTTKQLYDEFGRAPSEAEISERMSLSADKLRFVTGASRSTISLDSPIDRDDDSSVTLGSFIVCATENPEERLMTNMLRDDLETVLNTLTPKERDVIRMRYGFDDGRAKTLEEIGTFFSVTRERIRQIEAKALRKLRHPNRNAILREWVYES